MMARAPSTLLRTVREIVFPRRCVGCGVRGALLCPACEAGLPWLTEPICASCGSVGVHDAPNPRCPGPRGPLAEILVACAFEGAVRRAVHALKYRLARDHAPLLGALLARAQALNLGGIDALVPIPLSEARRRARGFNQAELIARELSAHLGLPLVADVVVRVRDTEAQVGKTAAERRDNVRDAFGCLDPSLVSGQCLALVDDVTTTGATLRACADSLLAAGAASVVGLAVAKEL